MARVARLLMCAFGSLLTTPLAARLDRASDVSESILEVEEASASSATGNKITPLISAALGVDQKLKSGELMFVDWLGFSNAFEETLGALGRAFKLGKKDFSNNIRKMTDARKKLELQGLPANPTCKEFLQAEKDTGIHKPGGKLKHESGVDGMLWIRRSCQWVLEIMAELVNGQPRLYDAAKAGYQKQLEQYHGWFFKKVFGGVIWNLPSKESFCRNLLDDQSSSDEDLMGACKSQMHELTEAASPMMQELVGIYKALDLEDVRKI